MPNYIKIQCNEKMQQVICTALRNFALIAYPKTPNSECNLVASDALLNAANYFETKFNEKGYGAINRRLRMIVKTAIEAHYEILAELDSCVTLRQCEVMLQICNGEIITNEQFLEAERVDKQS